MRKPTAALAALLWIAAAAHAVDPYAGNDPYWVLLHEPAVIAELKLSPAQRRPFQQLIDNLDLRFFPLRNKAQEPAAAGSAKITSDAQAGLKTLLQPGQHKRLCELVLRQLGNQALLHDDVASRLLYSKNQSQRLKEINEATQADLAALRKEASDGKPRPPLEQRFLELQAKQQKKLLEVLTPEQRNALRTLLGPPFDLAKLGQPRFKAPELIDTGQWINSPPLQLAKLRGKVVVVHFYACGCLNCIHNYPSYRQWHEKFAAQGVVLIGIHTPETASERDSSHVRRKAADDQLAFPILIDGKNENWNAWGNSIWPCVYLIDQRGYLREFWPGELKWHGADGEQYLRKRIEAMLGEDKKAKSMGPKGSASVPPRGSHVRVDADLSGTSPP